jgi:hypothetical protein
MEDLAFPFVVGGILVFVAYSIWVLSGSLPSRSIYGEAEGAREGGGETGERHRYAETPRQDGTPGYDELHLSPKRALRDSLNAILKN